MPLYTPDTDYDMRHVKICRRSYEHIKISGWSLHAVYFDMRNIKIRVDFASDFAAAGLDVQYVWLVV